jgi:flagellar basal-body rod modification protein FlgD
MPHSRKENQPVSVQNTLNQIQNNTNQVQFQQGRKNLGSSEMTREGFLRLLMAQMQYQDPTEPTDYSQMLGQQVQLEQVEQMHDLVNANKFAQAGAMVGQTAQLVDAPWDFANGVPGTPVWDVATNSPKTVTGVIQSVQFDRDNGKALVQINNKYYDAEQIHQLYATPPAQS